MAETYSVRMTFVLGSDHRVSTWGRRILGKEKPDETPGPQGVPISTWRVLFNRWSAAAKYFRRSMLAQDAYQVDSASDRIKLGLARARAGGKQVGRLPVLTPEQIEQCRRMADEGSGLRHIARVTTCSPATVKKALDAVPAGDPIIHTKPPGAARTFPSRL